LFGGVSANANTADLFHLTWEWDGRHWTARQDFGPQARWGHSMVFDSKRKRGVLFGGTSSAPLEPNQTVSGETWEQFEEGVPPDSGSHPPPGGNDVSGLVLDLAISATGEATLRVDGQPNLTATSDSHGAFSLSPVAPSETFDVIVSKPAFLDCRNEIGRSSRRRFTPTSLCYRTPR
jgi:hypothetical protein